MQNDMKCGLLEQKQGELSDTISKQAYVWYEKIGNMMIMNIFTAVPNCFMLKRDTNMFIWIRKSICYHRIT